MNGPAELSVIIPTFNRRTKVGNAIRSALPLSLHAKTEIIVVDDASSDGTVAALRAAFALEIDTGQLRLLASECNVGATGAKNLGAGAACGEWLVFLDSDDELLPQSMDKMVADLRGAKDAPVVFFRCAAHSGQRIGAHTSGVRELSSHDIVRWRWGECLPVVRRQAARQFPFDGDLRGHEGLAYARMTRGLGSARLSPLVVRIYDHESIDRLSSRDGIRARSCELARGHWRALHESWREFGLQGLLKQSVKVAYYALACAKIRSKGFFKTGVA